MQDYEYLIKILKASVEKHGKIPLTNKHLLNIILLAVRTEFEIADATVELRDME